MTESLHIVCPHCHTTNRVQAAQLGSQPDCGSCHQPLFTGAPLALDATSFAKQGCTGFCARRPFAPVMSS